MLLHAAHLFGPAVELLQVVEEFLRVLRDPEVVARNFALFNDRARTPAAAFDHLFVGENGLVDRVPVDDLGLAVGNALFEHAQKEPLVPAVVVGLAGGDFARPVEGEAERLHLSLHVGDVAVSPLRGGDLLRERRIFRGQTEGVPAHRGHDVVALHAVEAVHDVVEGVVADVAHMELAARVGQHGAHVELGLRMAFGVERLFMGAINVAGLPHRLNFGFDLLGGVCLAHNALYPV